MNRVEGGKRKKSDSEDYRIIRKQAEKSPTNKARDPVGVKIDPRGHSHSEGVVLISTHGTIRLPSDTTESELRGIGKFCPPSLIYESAHIV